MTQNIAGKRCIVTGANSGIGKALAHELAKQGAEVVLVCRNKARGEEALAEILAASGSKRVELMICDVGDMDSVRAFCAAWKARGEGRTKVDVLFNNAGVYLPNRVLTAQGHESMLAINHLGPFLMTALLADEVKGGRVITTSSFAHSWGNVDLDDLDYAKGIWVPMRQYGTTKLCNVLFTRELQKRYDARGCGTIATCFHPGAVGTGFGQDEVGFLNFGMRVIRPLTLTAQQGADTGLFLATTEDVRRFAGGYLSKRKLRQAFGQGTDDTLAAGLFRVSAVRVGLRDE